jgi:hypothetical protein
VSAIIKPEFWRHGRFVFRVGDWVRVAGGRGKAQIETLLSYAEGGVVLSKPLIGSRYWNVDALKKIRKRVTR